MFFLIFKSWDLLSGLGRTSVSTHLGVVEPFLSRLRRGDGGGAVVNGSGGVCVCVRV